MKRIRDNPDAGPRRAGAGRRFDRSHRLDACATTACHRRLARLHFRPMRFILAGIFQITLLTAVAFGQATGDIESIGYEQQFRPGYWTPMVVRLTPTGGAQFKGKIAVYQEDADHDHPIFTRPVSLTGNTEGGGDK